MSWTAEPGRVVLCLLEELLRHAPELARPDARRQPLAEPLAVDQPLRLGIAADDGGNDTRHSIERKGLDICRVKIYLHDPCRPPRSRRSSWGCSRCGRSRGYDIKAIVDRSTRFFWAASYGQIYPELRRLEAEGLIVGEDAPNGGRQRRVYSLTPAGREALVEWLLGPTVTIELRDESLLRLFFADALPQGAGADASSRGGSIGHEQYLETLRAIDARPGPGPAVRRPRPALGNRIQRMGCTVVSAAAGPLAERDEGGLTEPTFRGILMTGLPGFLREGFLPLGAFYAGLKLSGLGAGIAAAAVASAVVYLFERRAGRDGLLVRLSLAFVVVQSAIGLAAHSETVYLAQPVLVNAAWGIAFLVSAAIGRPLAGALAGAWYSFPAAFRQSSEFKRVYGVESIVWGIYFLARSGLRFGALLAGSLENFILVVFVTGPPMMLLLIAWSIRYSIRELSKD